MLQLNLYTYNAILFDLDDTLLLSEPSQLDALKAALAALPLKFWESDLHRAYCLAEIWTAKQIKSENQTGVLMPDKMFIDNLLNIYANTLNLDVESIRSVSGVLKYEFPRKRIVRPHAIELLDRLRSLNIRTGIVTNNPPSARDTINRMGLAACVDCIIISGEVGVSKPDPRILQLALDKLGVQPARAVYVGDSPYDMLCARKAGVKAIWMDNGIFGGIVNEIFKPDAIINSIEALELMLKLK